MSAKLVYWDANAWIGLINSEADKVFPLRAIWEDAQKGDYQILTSSYSYLEVIHGRTDYGEPYPPEEFDGKFEQLASQPFVKRVQLDVPIGRLARNLRRSHHADGLHSRPDAIHLASASHWNVDELHTWDGTHLLPLNGKVTRRDGKLLNIIIPGNDYLGAPLFAALPKPMELPPTPDDPKDPNDGEEQE